MVWGSGTIGITYPGLSFSHALSKVPRQYGYKNLWQECLDILLYWVEECGINIFRVDNPHTKPYYFWNWAMSEVKKKHPDVLFLAEAFTKPKVMQQLAKQGYTQSYTYFTWRNTKHEVGVAFPTTVNVTPEHLGCL